MIYLLMIYDFLSPCYYSVALYDYQFCITIAFRLLSTRLVRVLLFFLFLFLATAGPYVCISLAFCGYFDLSFCLVSLQ